MAALSRVSAGQRQLDGSASGSRWLIENVFAAPCTAAEMGMNRG